MAFYQITKDFRKTRYAVLDDREVLSKMPDFDISGFGQRLQFNWVTPSVSFITGSSKATDTPDISSWSGIDLVLGQPASTALLPLIDSLGECLTLDSNEEGEYTLFNPTARLGNDAVNAENTTLEYFDDGTFDCVERLVLNKASEATAPMIFTLALDGGYALYCTGAFKALLEEHQLSGLLFDAVESI